jgi:hypothetical protein
MTLWSTRKDHSPDIRISGQTLKAAGDLVHHPFIEGIHLSSFQSDFCHAIVG